MRVTLMLIAALLLGGCSNLVTSERPWFTHADEAGAPRLRPGLWVSVDDPKCDFDQRAPLERWPACADAMVVRPNDQLRLLKSETAGDGPAETTYDWTGAAYVLAAGNPLIEQAEGCPEPPRPRPDEPAAVDGVSRPAPAKPGPASDTSGPRHRYCYIAVEPTAFDSGGQIIAYVAWPVLCGPWPRDRKDEQGDPPVTDAPFPGLHVTDYDCTADDPDAVRAAARASKAIAAGREAGFPPLLTNVRWVREGYR